MATVDVIAAVHAGAGVAALGAGMATLRHPRWARVYLVCLVLCIAALVPLLVRGWGGFGTAERVIFSALGLLGLVVVERGVRAVRLLQATDRRSPAFQHSMGFTLIALLDAFVVILALDLGAPGWALVVIGVVVAAAGDRILDRMSERARVPATPVGA